MTWTYTNDPAGVNLDALRITIGDVDGDDPQLTDEELNWLLGQNTSVTSAALEAAKLLMALYARRVDKAVGDLKVSYSQRQQQYAALVKDLQQRVATRQALPFAGGISKSQKDVVDKDADRVEPAFKRDQFRHPGARHGRDDLINDE